jgi:L-seryl-tRNA(Ser) seleniumtransferase
MRRLRDSRVHRALSLPAIGALVNEPVYAELVKEFGHERVVEALRVQVAAERAGSAIEDGERAQLVGASLRAAVAPRLRHVINASGVILHTNLGRAPLARAALDALSVAAGYSNLELDLDSGRRGERAALVSGLLTQLFACTAAFVVNNNAAAVLLALTALCKGKEVIVSRGQQVEIGGSTNRTRHDDYEQAVTPRTAALLRVHTSNFHVAGFTEATSLGQMATVARAHELLLIDDLGSGAAEPIADEPTVAESLQHADVVTFSGDKLFGGPQAGIVLGRGDQGAAAVKKMSRHPLARAVRIDKLTLAALEATLRLRLTGRLSEIPVERMTRATLEDVRRRAAMWSVKLEERGVRTSLIPGESAVGGGSLPGHALPTVLIALSGPASRLAAALRHGDPPVIARIEKDACCLDPRTVLKGEDETLIDAVEVAFKAVAR